MSKQGSSSSGKGRGGTKKLKAVPLSAQLGESLIRGLLQRVSVGDRHGSQTLYPADLPATISTQRKDGRLYVAVEVDLSESLQAYEVLKSWFQSATPHCLRLGLTIELLLREDRFTE